MLLSAFLETVGYIGYILIAILVLLVMITVHELGHFLTGKFFNFKIEEFAIGFGPKIFCKEKKNGEKFSIRILPLGGFCAFYGENGEKDDENSFYNQKPWKRILVLISGALMNYLLAIIIIIIMFFSFGTPAFKVEKVNTLDGYSAENSFNVNDIIIKANGKNTYLISDIMDVIGEKEKGDKVSFTVIRNGEEKELNFSLLCDTYFSGLDDLKTFYLSLGLYEVKDNYMYSGLVSENVKIDFSSVINRSFEYSFKLAGTVFKVLGGLITGNISINSVGGTVTTVTTTANAIKEGGISYLLNITSLIGVNLAVFNLLPIPALDGSHVVFTIIEWIRKKPINKKVEGIIHTIGFVLLFAFAITVDLLHLF